MKESDKQASGFGIENSGNQYAGAQTSAFELAQMIGTTENRVYGIERGRYSPDTDLALRWAASLDLNPGEAFPEIWGAQ